MASSSRWKRFAFFDRKNLSLPNSVWEDVSPNDDGALSLAVTTHACLPSSSNTSSSSPVMDSSLSMLPTSSSMEDSDIQRYLGVQITSSLEGMVRSLTQSRGDGISHSSSSDTDLLVFHGDGKMGNSNFPSSGSYYDGYICLAFLSSPSSSVVHCIDLTWRCFPKHYPSSTTHTPPTVLGDTDGWRGSFDPFVYGRLEESSGAPSMNTTPMPSSVSSTATTTSSGVILPNTTTSTSASVVTKIVGLATTSSSVVPTEEESVARTANAHSRHAPFTPRTVYVACITDTPSSVGVCVHKNPHWYLSSTWPTASTTTKGPPRSEIIQPMGKFDFKHRGAPNSVDIFCHSNMGDGIVAVGTDKGLVLVYTFSLFTSSSSGKGSSKMTQKLNIVMEIPSPFYHPAHPTSHMGFSVTNLKLVLSLVHPGSKHTTPVRTKKGASSTNAPAANSTSVLPSRRTKLFVTYLRKGQPGNSTISLDSSSNQNNGVCCYELGVLGGSSISGSSTLSAPSARFDLDSRDVASINTCDVLPSMLISSLDTYDPGASTNPIQKVSNTSSPPEEDGYLMVARNDGLNIYSSHEKLKCIPLEPGESKVFSFIPPSQMPRKFKRRIVQNRVGHSGTDPNPSKIDVEGTMETALSSHIFLVLAEGKSSRDSMNIFDLTNKLVGFHTLLSPGQNCLRSVGFATTKLFSPDGSTRGGVSSCLILTSTGTLITITEKNTAEKVTLLVQKHLYSAAISLALSDVHYKAGEITQLYKQYAEYLFHKGDFQAAMDQYMYTIGSLEPSYVIFRYLDAPKLPFLTQYLEEMRTRGLSTPVQDELLRTCYLHLNETSSAEKITVSLSSTMTSSDSSAFISSLLHQPSQAFAALCSFEAPKAAETIYIHGPALVRSLPQEMASLVISLCEGSYCPGNFTEVKNISRLDHGGSEKGKRVRPDSKHCDQYPVELFSNAFLEHPKLLRTILAYCSRHNLRLTSSLKSALLELTLEEWNNARSTGDFDLETTRHTEAIAFLTDPKNWDMGDSETLVLVDLAGFTDGQTLLYERLNMIPCLVERYKKDGSEKARRQMLALSMKDPEVLGMVLSRFVQMAAQQDESVGNTSTIYEIIVEALQLARSQHVLPGARIARILAGDDYSKFNNGISLEDNAGIPLSVAIDYFGSTLESSSHEIGSLKTDISEYVQLCSSMEKEIQLLRNEVSTASSNAEDGINFDVDKMYEALLDASHLGSSSPDIHPSFMAEDFWRELEQSREKFDTMARFMSRGILE